MTPSVIDQAIEEAWRIFQGERDGEPCSLRRQRFLLMCHEIAQQHPLNRQPPAPRRWDPAEPPCTH